MCKETFFHTSKLDSILGIGYNPKCDENGDYYPVQCETKEYSSGGHSYEACWCADHLDGSKILGSTEYMTSANAEDQKMKMERKCAPSYGYQRYRVNLKQTQDYGYQQESRVAAITPPCKKTYDEIEKANAVTTAQTTVYNRYGFFDLFSIPLTLHIRSVIHASRTCPSAMILDSLRQCSVRISPVNVGAPIAMALRCPKRENQCWPSLARGQCRDYW